MKKIKINLHKFAIKLTILSAVGLSGYNASAENLVGGLFLEPGVTYELGKTSVAYPSPFSNSTGESKGFGLAARLGMHAQEIVFLGLDARYAMPQFTDSSVSYDAAAVSTNFGPVLGVQMPIVGLRLWGSYIMAGTLDPEQSGNIDVKFTNASGYRIGAGMRVALVSLNLEYQQLKYGETHLEKLGPFSSSSAFDNVRLENQTWLASVTFPLEL